MGDILFLVAIPLFLILTPCPGAYSQPIGLQARAYKFYSIPYLFE